MVICYIAGMATSTSTRIDDDVAVSASLLGDTMGRSGPQQIAHWARIGRALEMSPSVSHVAIAALLAGAPERRYDSLTEEEQAVVRAEWEQTMDARREALNFEDEFTAARRSYSELDADGNVVIRSAE